MSTDIRHPHTDWARTASRIALCGFLAVIAFFLWTEHRAHLFGALPYLLLLLCPAMHLFMHRGHGGGHTHDHGDDQ
jgi:hypothetical protein